MRSLVLVIGLAVFFAPLPAWAQESDKTTASTPEADADAPEDTLPEVVVRPAEEDEDPPEPPQEPEDEPDPAPPQSPAGYPSLGDVTFGGLDSGLRSSRSIFDDPRHATVVGSQRLAEIAPGDMGRALEQTTGVMIQRTGRGQSSPFVRGLTGQQVLIMVDGVRMTNATVRAGPNQYFNTIDPGMVERIEVVRGPGSVLFGSDAIGGVINVVTKSPSRLGYDFTTGGTVQRFSTADAGYYGRLSVEGSMQSLGFYGGTNYGNFNNVDRGGSLGRQPATSFMHYGGDIKFTYQLDEFTELIASLNHFEQQDVFRSDRFPADRQTIFDPQQRDLAYLRLHGYCLAGWFDEYSITASYTRTKEGRLDRRPIASLVEDQREFDDDQTGLNFVFANDLCCWGKLTYGFDWYHEDVDAKRQRVDSTTDPPTVTQSTSTQFPDDAHYSRYGLFLEWDVPLTERLSAVSGVRYEHITAGATVTVDDAQGNPVTGPIDPEYQDWVGSVGLTYELNPCWHVVTSISEGFRAPNLDDLAATNDNVFQGVQIPNPQTQPERSINYEVGVKLDGDRFRAQTFVWWTDLQNHILRRQTADPGFVLQRDNHDSYLQGVEFDAEYLLHSGWSLYGNFAYTYGKDKVAAEPLSRIPPPQGIAGLRWRDPCGCGWIDVYGWFVGKQDRLSARDQNDTIRIPAGGTPGFATLNFRYGRMLGPRSRLTLNLENVTDTPYRVHGSGTDGAGIDFIVGYEVLH